MRTRTKLGIVLITAVLSLLLTLPAAATHVAPVVYDDWKAGSAEAECGRIGYSFGLKVEGEDTS